MSKPAFDLVGFYGGKPIFGDGLTRGIGSGPEDKRSPHQLRWCPQCKAVFQWSEPGKPDNWPDQANGWTRRDCPVCEHREGVATAFTSIVRLLAPLCRYKPIPQAPDYVQVIPWPEVACELTLAELTPEQFLAADLADLRRFWEYLAAQIKSKREAA